MDFPIGDYIPNKHDVKMAMGILKRRSAFYAWLLGQLHELQILMLTKDREGSLSLIHRNGDVGVELIQTAGGELECFHLYDFNSKAELIDGFKLIRNYMETGIHIPFHSMVDKRLQTKRKNDTDSTAE